MIDPSSDPDLWAKLVAAIEILRPLLSIVKEAPAAPRSQDSDQAR